MDVRIVDFPETRVAAVEHHGAPEREHETTQRLIRWRIRHRVSPGAARTYGVHHTDPLTVPPEQHRVDFCVSYDGPVEPNDEGVVVKTIPHLRCAVARHFGSRSFNSTAVELVRDWLPRSGETLGDFPIFFHYVNIGPDVRESEMLTDVYLPLRAPAPR